MGNGVLFNIICCNSHKAKPIEDIDINKNIKENKDNNHIEDDNLEDKVINKEQMNKINQKSNYKKTKTHINKSSNKKKLENNEDTKSHKDPKISLYNNTFQILNNTQQFISISNKINLFKNNLANNNKIYKSYNNSLIDIKNSSILNYSRVNNIEDLFLLNIKTKLILSGELFLHEKIEIDKFGMKNGLRQKHDGCSIFGIKNNNDKTQPCKYDYLLDIKSDENNSHLNKKQIIGKVFEIFVDKKDKVYVLSYLNSSLLLYYKIKTSLFFDDDKEYYLILGDIFLTVGVKKNLNSNEKIINLKVEIEDEKPKKYSFKKKDLPIKIGRVNSNINIQKPSISKIHGIIDMSNDMFFYNDMKSTNGSTLLLKEDDYLKIKGEMNFKLEDISFKIKEVENLEK